MSALWRWVSLRHLLGEGWRTLLTLAGVALGVAVFVSIRLANHSAMSSFSQTVDAVVGKSNLQIVGDSTGFDERVFPAVRATPGVTAAAPVVQVYALARKGGVDGGHVSTKLQKTPFTETLLVLGFDLLSEEPFGRFEAPGGDLRSMVGFLVDPRAVAITRTLADRLGLRVDDSLTLLSAGKQVPLNVRAILDAPELQDAMGGNVVLCDIVVAQEAFGRYGKLDRIDLLVPPERKAEIQAALTPILPPPARVSQPQSRTRQVENMVEAFALNLTALSFIALFVSMFLIFNAVSLSVLRRRGEIGILRSLGQTRASVLRQFLAEALCVGVVGSLAGLALGTLLARETLGSVARTITTLYLIVEARNVPLDFPTYGAGLALGIGATLVSALAPALEASRIPPTLAVRQGALIEAQPMRVGKWSLAGVALVLLAAGIAAWTIGARRPFGGFVSAALLIGGFSLLAPGYTLLIERLVTPLIRAVAGMEGVLGARYLREALARTSVVVAALMVSVGMMIGLSIMVGSFRQTVDLWVTQTIKGDLYIEPVGRGATGSATILPPALVETARRLPGVAAVDTYRGVEITYNNRISHVVGIDFAIQRAHGRIQFLRGDSPTLIGQALAREGVLISESFSHRHQVGEGGFLTLNTPSGQAKLPVVGVYYDYSTDAGTVMMDYRLYARLWRDPRTESLAVYVRPGANVDAIRRAFVAKLPPGMEVAITPNQDLRKRVMYVFDQTFQIIYALQAIAILVAVLGVVGALTALINQRGREIGVLRAVGGLRRQVRKMVLVESGLLGFLGATLGCVCGVALSLLLIYVINKQFFGWSIRMFIDPWLFPQAVALMVGTAVLAGLVPARLAAGRLAAEAMRAE
jgi:putative ABC transport system permease protein